MNLPKVLRKFPYWYLLAVPVLLIGLGAASNQAVLVANHGKFPVMLNDAQVSRFCEDDRDTEQKLIKRDFSVLDSSVPDVACIKGGQFLDPVHSIMGKNSNLKALADVFNLGDGLYSIGDFGIMLGEFFSTFTFYMWIALTVRKLATLVP